MAFSFFLVAASFAFISLVTCKLECTEPISGADPSPSDTVHLLISKSVEEARTVALCHVLCINEIFEFNPNGTLNATDSTLNGSAAENMV